MQYEMTVTRSSNRCRSTAGSWKQLPICQVCWFGFSWERSFVSCGARKGARFHTKVPCIWGWKSSLPADSRFCLAMPCSYSLHASSSGVRQGCYLHPKSLLMGMAGEKEHWPEPGQNLARIWILIQIIRELQAPPVKKASSIHTGLWHEWMDVLCIPDISHWPFHGGH